MIREEIAKVSCMVERSIEQSDQLPPLIIKCGVTFMNIDDKPFSFPPSISIDLFFLLERHSAKAAWSLSIKSYHRTTSQAGGVELGVSGSRAPTAPSLDASTDHPHGRLQNCNSGLDSDDGSPASFKTFPTVTSPVIDTEASDDKFSERC